MKRTKSRLALQEHYPLSAPQATRRVEKHYRAIRAALPDKPLHEIPMLDLMATTAHVLSKRDDFAFQKENPPLRGGCFHPLLPDGRVAYAYYELGNRLIMERVLSRLRAKKVLDERHADDYRALWGRLFQTPPSTIQAEKLEAFDRLNNELGQAKFKRVAAETLTAIAESGNETYAARALASDANATPKQARQARLALKLDDAFLNPYANHELFMVANYFLSNLPLRKKTKEPTRIQFIAPKRLASEFGDALLNAYRVMLEHSLQESRKPEYTGAAYKPAKH